MKNDSLDKPHQIYSKYTKIITAADIVMSNEHTIDGRVVDVKRAVARDKAPAPTRYTIEILG